MKYSEVAESVWPYLLPKVQRALQRASSGGGGSGGVGGAPTPHALSSIHHTGTLNSSQAPQFLLRDGTRSLTGHLEVASGITIDGVDLSAHVANPDAHHDRATAGNDGILMSGQSVLLRLAADPGLELSSGVRLKAGQGIGRDSTGTFVKRASPDSGLAFDLSGALQLGTPLTITPTSTNVVSGVGHNHSVDSASDVSGANAARKILNSTTAGGLGLASLFTTGAVDVGQGFTAGNSGLRVIYHTHDYPHVHMVVNPGGSWNLDEQFGLDIDDNLLVRGWIVGKHAIQLDGATMLLHFDGPERIGNLSGQTRGHMGQVPIEEIGLTFAPGKFGKAVYVPESTTNLFTNPSLETDTANWFSYSSGTATGTRTRTLSQSYAGSYSYELVKTGGGADADRWGVRATVAGIVSGTTYTISVWINVIQASGGAKRFRVETANAFGSNFSTFLTGPTDGWVRKTVTLTASSSGTGEVRVYSADVTTATFYVDALQVEAKSYATAYCDGSLGGGHSWSGSAHASSSSRGAASLRYNSEGIVNRREGTFMCWFNPSTNSIWEMLFSVGSATWVRAHAGVFQLKFGGTETMGGSATYSADTWTHVAFTWENDTINFYVNGALSRTASPATWGAMSSSLTIGYYGPDNNQRSSGLIDDVVFLNRAATADEVRAVYESNAPVFAETSTWQWRAGRNRIYADSEGLWGVGASGSAILGLYAGDDADPAATKSWGGLGLSEGDFLLGRYGASNGGWMLFDQDLVGGKPALRWGYADQEIIRFDSGGASLYGVLDIDTNGGIYQGTGTFSSPTIGLKLWNDGGIGRIGGYSGGLAQWYADTSGRLRAGAGSIAIDRNGATIFADSARLSDWTTFDPAYGYTFRASDGAPAFGWVGGATGGNFYDVTLQSLAPFAGNNTKTAELNIRADAADVAWGAGTAPPQIRLRVGGASMVSKLYLNAVDLELGAAFTRSGAALGAYQGKLSVNIAGTNYWIPYYA